jgi:hypothetical protein
MFYYIWDMGLLFDALTGLEDRSLELQERSASLMRTHKLLVIKYRVFELMYCNPEEHFQQALNSTIPGIFQGIPVRRNKTRPVLQESM